MKLQDGETDKDAIPVSPLVAHLDLSAYVSASVPSSLGPSLYVWRSRLVWFRDYVPGVIRVVASCNCVVGQLGPLRSLVKELRTKSGWFVVAPQKQLVQRTDRVKGVDVHPTEPW